MRPWKKRANLIINPIINVFEYCPRGYIEGGYYFLQGLQLRALLERGFYSREGLI